VDVFIGGNRVDTIVLNPGNSQDPSAKPKNNNTFSAAFPDLEQFWVLDAVYSDTGDSFVTVSDSKTGSVDLATTVRDRRRADTPAPRQAHPTGRFHAPPGQKATASGPTRHRYW
jgi:hypothetical protein